jgi:hypothetical protein
MLVPVEVGGGRPGRGRLTRQFSPERMAKAAGAVGLRSRSGWWWWGWNSAESGLHPEWPGRDPLSVLWGRVIRHSGAGRGPGEMWGKGNGGLREVMRQGPGQGQKVEGDSQDTPHQQAAATCRAGPSLHVWAGGKGKIVSARREEEEGRDGGKGVRGKIGGRGQWTSLSHSTYTTANKDM